jgi:hypothetical protein
MMRNVKPAAMVCRNASGEFHGSAVSSQRRDRIAVCRNSRNDNRAGAFIEDRFPIGRSAVYEINSE